MRIRFAVSLFALALALAGAGLAPAMTYEIRTTGTVVSKSADALVVRIDDHGHRIRFEVDRATLLSDGVAPGQHVQVTYHPTGSTGQAADSVTVVPGSDKASTAWATPPAKADAKSASY
jgi:hypothetical protein